MKLEFEAELWEYQGESPWVFVTLPVEVADGVREARPNRRPFGSVKVTVEVGDSRWQTSLFPDRNSDSYVLPIKRDIRRHETLGIGDSARFVIELEE